MTPNINFSLCMNEIALIWDGLFRVLSRQMINKPDHLKLSTTLMNNIPNHGVFVSKAPSDSEDADWRSAMGVSAFH